MTKRKIYVVDSKERVGEYLAYAVLISAILVIAYSVWVS